MVLLVSYLVCYVAYYINIIGAEMIKIICKECGKEYQLTELDSNLRSKKEIKCVECGHILVPKVKKW